MTDCFSVSSLEGVRDVYELCGGARETAYEEEERVMNVCVWEVDSFWEVVFLGKVSFGLGEKMTWNILFVLEAIFDEGDALEAGNDD